MKSVPKLWRDVIQYHHGTEPDGNGTATYFDVDEPWKKLSLLPDETDTIPPGPNSPICQKCGLFEAGNCRHPFFKPRGSKTPKITLVVDGIHWKEDDAGSLGSEGMNHFMLKQFKNVIEAKNLDINLDTDIRISPLTRCAVRTKKKLDLKTRGRWCKFHLYQDLRDHPPELIIPIGSVATGALSHKGNAQEWSGRVLRWRGWPDDWLTDKKFMFDRPDPRNPEEAVIKGHYVFGPKPKVPHIPIIPLQNPRIVFAAQNPQLALKWQNQVFKALRGAVEGVPVLDYNREWYELAYTPDDVIDKLAYLIQNPGTVVAYDTETTGLRPWAEDAKIVSMMFRWEDKEGKPQSVGFLWDCEKSPIREYVEPLTEVVLEALYASKVIGHNLTFDALYSFANLTGADLDKLASAMVYDTWHMAYTMRQERGSLGLEVLAYRFTPDLAGYEEELTLLIDLHDEMNPEKGGHYANCPEELWESAFKPYIMGDVEVAYRAHQTVTEKLSEMKQYKIPLAHPTNRGRFRLYGAPSREMVYNSVISPAARTLIKMMARGMHVDIEELERQEDMFPKQLIEMREELRTSDPRIVDWCTEQEEVNEGKWEFDLDKPDQLKSVLFGVLQLPIDQLTDAGVKQYGENPRAWSSFPFQDIVKAAKTDKFTLNKLAAKFEQVRPLQKYRKLFKAYGSYIRPIRNSFNESFDKKERTRHQHLCPDGLVHARFLITGTRSGRLASVDPNLQQLPADSTVKRIYNSRFGERGCIYSGDLSQIELRIIAAACGDTDMVKAYCEGIDLHSMTMSKIFNRPYEECVKDYQIWLQNNGRDKEAKQAELDRRVSKTVNFLTGYGGGAHGLMATLSNGGIYYSLEECEKILESFFDSYPALRQYLSYYKRFIQDNGVAVSISGRVRVFEDVWSDNKGFVNKALRAGCNHLIQATASDIMLVCLCVIEALMREANLESILISTVHDSLVIDLVKEEAPIVHDIVINTFSNIPEIMSAWMGDGYDDSWLIVPFGGDCEVGPNYLDLHRIPDDNIDWDELLSHGSEAA